MKCHPFPPFLDGISFLQQLLINMNNYDRKQLEIVNQKIEDLREDIHYIKSEIDKDHEKVYADIKFIKENLFNPHEGLWAETKMNSLHRKSTAKWRSIIGAGLIGLIFKQVMDVFK